MKRTLRIVFVIVCVPIGVLCAYGYLSSRESVSESSSSYEADGLIEDYNFLVRNNGPMMDRCARAGAIVQTYVRAHEDDNYNHWRAIAQEDCEKAKRTVGHAR